MIRVDHKMAGSDVSDGGLYLSDEPALGIKSNSRTKFTLSPELRPHSSPRVSLAELIKGRADNFSDSPSAVVGQSINGIRKIGAAKSRSGRDNSSFKHFTTPPEPSANRDLEETLNRLSQENLDVRAELKVYKSREAKLEQELAYALERKAYYKKAAVESHESAKKACEVTSTQKGYIENLEKQTQTANSTIEELKSQLHAANELISVLRSQIEGLESQMRTSQDLEEELKKRAENAEKRAFDLENQIGFMEKVFTSSRPATSDASVTLHENEPQDELEQKRVEVLEVEQKLKQVKKRLDKKLSKFESLSTEYSRLKANVGEIRRVSSAPTSAVQQSPASPVAPVQFVSPVASAASTVPTVPTVPAVTTAPTAPTAPENPAPSVAMPPTSPTVAVSSAAPKAPETPLQEDFAHKCLELIRSELSSLKDLVNELAVKRPNESETMSKDMKDILLQLSKVVLYLKTRESRDSSPMRLQKTPETRTPKAMSRNISTPAELKLKQRRIPRMHSTHSLTQDAFIAEDPVPELSEDSTNETVIGDPTGPTFNDQLLAEAKRQLIEMGHPEEAEAMRFIGDHLTRRS